MPQRNSIKSESELNGTAGHIKHAYRLKHRIGMGLLLTMFVVILNLSSRIFLELARTIYIRYIYGIFGRKTTKYTVIYGVYIRFWPTLHISASNQKIAAF